MVHDLMGYSEYEEHGYDSLARRWWNGFRCRILGRLSESSFEKSEQVAGG